MPDLPFMTLKTLLPKRYQYSYLAFFAHRYSPRTHFAARFRFVASLLAYCVGKRFAFPQLRTLAGSNPSAIGPKKKDPHCWRPIKSVVGDEGCRVRLRRPLSLRAFGPRVLRWKTLRVSSAPHPCGFESLCTGHKKRKAPIAGSLFNQVVGDEGFEPPALCV